MAVDKSKFDDILESGIDYDKRRIHWGDISYDDTDEGQYFAWSTVEYCIRAMKKMYELGSGPIELHMSSGGGCPYEMLRLIDEIESAPVQIKFYGAGMIASAATWVMAVCDYRYLHKSTTVMVHDGSEASEDRFTDFQIFAQHTNTLQDRLYDIFETNSRMPKSFWQDVCQRDMYLTAEETVELGLADEIIAPKKRGNLRKARIAKLAQIQDPKHLQKTLSGLYKRINKKSVPKLHLASKAEEFDDALLVPEPTLQQQGQDGTALVQQEQKQKE